jgi:hypothetical protein
MKKNLLASTAIVGASLLMAAPAAAQGPDLSISGHVKFEMWFDDQDEDLARVEHFEIDDAEIRFIARARADNGLRYDLKIELDVDTSSGDVETDEARIQLSGGWGTMRLGDDDGVEEVMTYAGENLMIGQSGFDGGLESGFDFLGAFPRGPDLIGDTEDATKISYFTPRFLGFQAGVSFTPDSGHDLSEGRSRIKSFDLRAPSSSFFRPAPFGVDTENNVAAGVNFVRNFGGLNLAVSAIGLWADAETRQVRSVLDADDVLDPDPFEIEDVFSWQAGGTIGWRGIALGGGYGESGDSLSFGDLAKRLNEATDGGTTPPEPPDLASVDPDYHFWSAAARYRSGPFAAHLGYFRSESQGWEWRRVEVGDSGDTDQDDVNFFSFETEIDIYTLGAEYVLAPGLKFYAEYDRIKIDQKFEGVAFDNDSEAEFTLSPEKDDNEGNVFMLGAQVSF